MFAAGCCEVGGRRSPCLDARPWLDALRAHCSERCVQRLRDGAVAAVDVEDGPIERGSRRISASTVATS